MISLTTLKSKDQIKEFYQKQNIPYNENSNCLTAMQGEEVLGFCLFDLDDKAITIRSISPLEDISLCDGILRSSLHVAVERNIAIAFYEETHEKLFEVLKFIEDKDSKTLKINKLFESCCSCK